MESIFATMLGLVGLLGFGFSLFAAACSASCLAHRDTRMLEYAADIALALGMAYMCGAMAGIFPAITHNALLATFFSTISAFFLSAYIVGDIPISGWRANGIDLSLRSAATAYMFLPLSWWNIMLTFVFAAYHVPCLVNAVRSFSSRGDTSSRLYGGSEFLSGTSMIAMLVMMQVLVLIPWGSYCITTP